jgi:hypothetical protein
MNTLYFIARVLLSAGLSCITSIACSMIMLALLASLVDVLRLNYKSDTYWALNVVLVGLVISWIFSFISFMSIIK